MRSNAQKKLPPPTREELLAMLSESLDRRKTEHNLFAANLLECFTQMERAGYTIGTPYKTHDWRHRGFAFWHVPITTLDAHCIATFKIPENA